MAGEAQRHRQGGNDGGALLSCRVKPTMGRPAHRATRVNSSLTPAVSKPYGTPRRAKLAEAAMARVQERTTRRALQEALRAARAGSSHAAQESALLQSRSH